MYILVHNFAQKHNFQIQLHGLVKLDLKELNLISRPSSSFIEQTEAAGKNQH